MMINSYTKFGKSTIAGIRDSIVQLWGENAGEAEELVIVTPHLPESQQQSWQHIHLAWRNICLAKNDCTIAEWRTLYKYGEQVIPGSRLFQLRNSRSPLYFYLFNEEGLAESHIFDCCGVLSALSHSTRGGFFIHAAGVVRGCDAFLFLGASGAGKSTAAENSSRRGHSVIHDDHLVLFKREDGVYVVANRTLSQPPYPLKALFFLFQDSHDCLVPLNQKETTMRLLESCKESVGAPLLHGRFLRELFHRTADLSRKIPAYQLHLKNHPGFWDVIEANFAA